MGPPSRPRKRSGVQSSRTDSALFSKWPLTEFSLTNGFETDYTPLGTDLNCLNQKGPRGLHHEGSQKTGCPVNVPKGPTPTSDRSGDVRGLTLCLGPSVYSSVRSGNESLVPRDLSVQPSPSNPDPGVIFRSLDKDRTSDLEPRGRLSRPRLWCFGLLCARTPVKCLGERTL